MNDREAQLNQRANDLDKRQKDVVGREKAVAVIERSSFDDGFYKVGSDIKPGTYHTSGGGSCYWARLRSSDSFDIADNHLGGGPQTVVISSGWFETTDCGTWSLVG